MRSELHLLGQSMKWCLDEKKIVKTDKDGTKKIADQRDSEFLENNL